MENLPADFHAFGMSSADEVSLQNLLDDAIGEAVLIDPATTLPDHQGRPMFLLDEREPIRELAWAVLADGPPMGEIC